MLFLVAVGCMLFKLVEEGGNGSRVPIHVMCCKGHFCVPFYPTQAKMLSHSTTEQLGSRNGSKPRCGQLKPINSALDWFPVQTPTTLLMTNILGMHFNVASHQQCPWLWVLMLAVFSVQRWMHGHCPVNSGASCPAEQTTVGHSSTGNLFITSASPESRVSGRKDGLIVRPLD